MSAVAASAVARYAEVFGERDKLRALIANPPVSEKAAHRELAYPSLVAHLTLRFDDSLLNTDLELEDDRSAFTVENGIRGTSPARILRPLLVNDGKSYIRHIVPLACNVDLPKAREAGTFTFRMLFEDFPLDPRPLAGIGIEIHAGVVSAADFARGMSGEWAQGQRPSILNRFTDDTARLVGYADEMTTEHPQTGISSVTITGRDLRGVLLDAEFPVRKYPLIDLTQPIDIVVRQILLLDPLGDEFARAIEVQPQEWPNETVPSPDASKTRGRAFIPPPTTTPSYWDMITHVCTMVGAVPFFRGARLRIRPGRALHDERNKGLFDPVLDLPFRNAAGQPSVRQDDDGHTFKVRRYVYGRNVGGVKFTKKFSGVKVPVIRVVSLDTESDKRGADKLISAEWPEHTATKARKNRQSPSSGQKAEGEPLVIPVPGLTSKERALEVAKDFYNEIGRQEMGGDYSAMNLSSLGGDGNDPDNLRIQPGEAVEFYAAVDGFGSRSPLMASIADRSGTSFGEAVKAVTDSMEAAGWAVDENLARVVVATARGTIAKILNVFRVTSVRLEWDGVQKRISVAFSFDNFLISRFGVTPSNGPVTKPPVATTTRKKRQPKPYQTAKGAPSSRGPAPSVPFGVEGASVPSSVQQDNLAGRGRRE